MTKPVKTFRVSGISVIAFIGIACAALLRFSLREFRSGDFLFFVGHWYEIVGTNGFGVIRTAFYDYTPPYIYALYLLSRALPRLSPVFATKLPSIAADFICAWYASRIVRLNYKVGPVPIFAAFAVLFAPTVVINSAVWGQTDMLFTAPLVASLYYVLRRKERAAWIAIGLAFSIKPQAIFLAPFLLSLLLRKELSWRNVLWAPMIWLVSLLPAWFAGRPIYELLTIYSSQGALQAGKLTWRAPNLYTWLPQERFDLFFPAGTLLAAGIAIIFIAVACKSRTRFTPQLLIGLALASVLIMPYVLPGMHERYFFAADVLAILFAFFVPAYSFLPILIGMVSFFAYQPFLFKREIIPLPWLALALLIGVIILARWLVRKLYPKETFCSAHNDGRPGPEKTSSLEASFVASLYPARDPIFIHRPNGEPSHGITEDVVRDFQNLQKIVLANSTRISYAKPREATFITYNSFPEESLIERCYKAYGIEDAVVLGRGVEKWDWYAKVGLVLEYLDSGGCGTPYVLVTDAKDVLMINNPAPLIDRFLTCNAEILFCNTFVDWPPNAECRDFEIATYPSNPLHCRLSAGAYLARTESLLRYLRRLQAAHATEEAWTLGFHGRFDDQLAWRHLHRQEYPRIQVDSLSKIFRRYDIFRGTDGNDAAEHLSQASAAWPSGALAGR